ncbi:glycoside hydrolase family 43 protein [Sporanaerobium hydrogeniformans]|uniref:glycoside hydrolase family 43 protein n=1 Tax=Sporanaerobium hydrogeniformans TaxID=3072179 RepID=UPI0026D1B615|nr:glycoside hydrolase 43 family protein [Sporanaerobium hydrogeniformans]
MRWQNPIIFSDFSDPDIIKVEDDFYMVASSFTYLPGIPLLHSKDLIHWRRINYCVRSLPFKCYNQPNHGAGTWAPAIRYHKGWFYVFVPLPDEGIFVTKTQDPYGEWSPLHCLKSTKGWIDPCPFWDEDGKAYMIHAFAKSRCGIKHRLAICQMNEEATELLDEGKIVYDGEQRNPTIEGPKLYKRNGYYYIFAPAGGVETGWQVVLRSKKLYGPYEEKVVLHQGETQVNGPHQGGYVELTEDECYFVHFQDANYYGRIVHLQPMSWYNDWPFIGQELNGDGIGEPVVEWERTNTLLQETPYNLIKSDTFNQTSLGLQWQWQANPNEKWYSLTERPNYLRLYAMPNKAGRENLLWYAPHLLTQMIEGPDFEVEVEIDISGLLVGDRMGIGLLGHQYKALTLVRKTDGLKLELLEGNVLETSKEGLVAEEKTCIGILEDTTLYFKILFKQGLYQFTYWAQNTMPQKTDYFKATKGTWVGAKLMLFCSNDNNETSSGYCDFASFKWQSHSI